MNDLFLCNTYSSSEVPGSSGRDPKRRKAEEFALALVCPTEDPSDSRVVWESYNPAALFHHPDLSLSGFAPQNLCLS